MLTTTVAYHSRQSFWTMCRHVTVAIAIEAPNIGVPEHNCINSTSRRSIEQRWKNLGFLEKVLGFLNVFLGV